MKSFLKKVGVFFLILIGLIILGTISYKIWEEYDRLSWEPELTFDGLTLDMTKSDIYFIKGEPLRCSEYQSTCVWGKSGQHLVVNFEEDEVRTIVRTGKPYGYSPPFKGVEEMKEILGEQDILGISEDLLDRRYTYLDWGITFYFKTNNLSAVMIGEVQWRPIANGQYFIKGKQICPSDNCPWDDEGNLKPEYEDKDYKIFLE